MSKSENEKWIATIPTQSSANNGKIDLVSDLLVPYSTLSAYFLRDIDLRFVRDNELSKYTKAKGYQTEDQFDALLVNCDKRYQKQIADGVTPTRSLKEQLEDIHKYAVQTPLSARFVQTCYSQTVEIYKSWQTKLEDEVRSYLTNSSVSEKDEFFLLSTLEKGKPIYLPLNRNPYLDECLSKGNRKPFVQLRLDGKKCIISAIVEYDKAPLRQSESSLGLDFGMVSMFTTSDGEQHGLTSFAKLKVWDEELIALTKELQEKGIKFKSNARYVQLQNRIKSYFKNEICRILNKLAKKNVGVFVVEQLDFRASGLSRSMNRLIGRTYRSFVKAKLARLEEQFGIQIVSVNPAYTSQECSRCHYVSKNNRKSQKQFICEHCRLHCNADVNAGRVIVQRRSLISKFPVYGKKGTSRTIRCQVREASEECHRRYCLDNELSTTNASLAESSL